MFTKEQYLEMILDELDFQDIKPVTQKNNLIAHLAKAKKKQLVKFYEILCDETTNWIKEQTIINIRYK